MLEEEGFEVAEVGVRLSKDPVFRTGSVYRRHSDSDSTDLLARFVEKFTDDEARRLKVLLRRRADSQEVISKSLLDDGERHVQKSQKIVER